MVKAQDTLAAKFVAGVTAVVMTLSAFAGFAPQAQAQASDINALCAVVASLQAAGNSNATLDALAVTAGCSGDVVVVAGDAGTYLYHPNVDFEFTRNLYIGSRGNDVKMLQMALNASADTKVAVSGAGSPGMETEYFGPATRAAVVKFQVKTGVTPALGYFYPLTRAEMNKRVAGTPVTPTTPSTGGNGDLNVSEGDNPDEDLFPYGATRFVVTAFELDGEADVESITVRYNGDADEDEIIDSVLLLDEDMNIVGDEETLDSDQEATFDVDMEVDGDVMMYIAVNAVSGGSAPSLDAFEDNDGLEFTFDVVEIEADGDVDGLPVSGTEFTVQDNIDLGEIDVTLSHEDKTVEIGSEEEEMLTIDIDANPDDSDDSVFIKSIRLTNEGNGDLEDLDNIYIEVDNEEFDGEISSMDDDILIFNFGNGFELEDGDSEDFTVYADVTGGATDTFRFVIDENSDIYAESEDGYGMPLDASSQLADGVREVEVSAGKAELDDNDDEDQEDITVGSDIVLGIFDFEVEGEGITIDTLTLMVNVSNGTVIGGDVDDIDELLLEDVRLELDGNDLTDSEDAEWDGAAPVAYAVTQDMKIEFDNVDIPEGDHEGIMIVATISDEVDNGTVYEVGDIEDDLTDTLSFNDVEGMDSEEEVEVGQKATFDARTVEAAVLEVSFEANTPSNADRTTTDDVDNVHVATIEFDARDSGEDVEITRFDATLAFFPLGGAQDNNDDKIEEISNCRLFDEDNGDEYELSDEVEGEEGDDVYEFELDDALVVAADESMKVEIRCDLGNGLDNTDEFQWSFAGIANDDVTAEGVTTGNDENDGIVTVDALSAAAVIEIASAQVSVASDSDTPDAQVIKFGEEVVLGILEIEADNGEATIDAVNVELTNIAVIDDAELYIYFEGDREDTVDVTGGAANFENLNIVVEDGENIQLEIRGDASLSVTGQTQLQVNYVELEDGTQIDDDADNATNLAPVLFNTVDVFEGVPVITLISDVTIDNLDTSNDAEIFEIAIEADGEDVTVDLIELNFDVANTVVSDLRFEVFENASHTNEAGTNNESNTVVVNADINSLDFTFTPITIPDGDTYYFVLMGDPTVSDDTRSIRVTLQDLAGEGVNFVAGVGDSSVVLEDDIEVLHRD